MRKDLTKRRDFLRQTGGLALAGVAGKSLWACLPDSPDGDGGGRITSNASDSGAPNTDNSHDSGVRSTKGTVRTVRGMVSPEQLGITDMHEHVLRDHVLTDAEAIAMFDLETLSESAALGAPEPVPASFFPEEPNNPITLANRGYLTHFYQNAEDQYLLDEDLMLGELRDFAALGGKTILDCSITWERGNPETIRRMSEATGVNVVMSTGINSHTLIPAVYKEMTAAQLATFFERELFEGIAGTDILAGNIKLLAEGKAWGVRATEDAPLLRGLEAAANVSRNTGAPVTLHAYLLGTEDYMALLTKVIGFGMPRDRMILSHFSTALGPMDYATLIREPQRFAPDFEMGHWALDRGFVLSFDLFGSGHGWDDSREGLVPAYDPIAMSAIYHYVKAGDGDRIVLGADVWMRTSTRRYGGEGISHLLSFVVPKLMEAGLRQDEVDQILIHTPARMLAF